MSGKREESQRLVERSETRRWSTVHTDETTRIRDTGRREKERLTVEEGGNERERARSLAGGSGTKARGEAERERERTEAAPRGGTRWGLSGRKPSAVNI